MFHRFPLPLPSCRPDHHQAKRRSARVFAVLALGLSVAACGASPTPFPAATDASTDTAQPDTTKDGAQESWCKGQWVDVAGERFCVEAIGATETGFQCPPDMFPYGGEGFGWAACGPEGFEPQLELMEQQIIAQNGLSCGQMKLDILVVMDTSTSMCQEQVAMANAMKGFMSLLQGYDADIQFAATSVDVQCDYDAATNVFASKGQFNQVAADRFPAACFLKDQTICSDDSDCGPEADWRCQKENLDACIENPNGSINTSCSRRCDTDAECVSEYGAGAICQQAGPTSSGCIVPPETASCAAATGPILDNSNIDQLECVTTTGVYSNKCFKYEQGLKAAWMALDPKGALPVQSIVFLRPDARLAIVFVTDEDDCSTATDDLLVEDQYNTCAFLDDTDNGGPLMPIKELADKYRSLKASPSMVSVLAIAGDSLAALDADKQADRAAFTASKQDPRICHEKSYICDSNSGTADWGSRYQALTEEFGDNGLFRNICLPEETGNAFEDLLENLENSYILACSPT